MYRTRSERSCRHLVSIGWSEKWCGASLQYSLDIAEPQPLVKLSPERRRQEQGDGCRNTYFGRPPLVFIISHSSARVRTCVVVIRLVRLDMAVAELPHSKPCVKVVQSSDFPTSTVR